MPQAFDEAPPHDRGAFDQALALDDLDIAQTDRAAHRVAAIGGGVHVAAIERRVQDRVVHPL